MLTPRKTIVVTAFLATAWVAAVSLGFRALASYENTPGETGIAPGSWPRGSSLGRAADRPTLVMFAHPRCPCTRASIGELAQIMAQAAGGLSAHVVFLKPEDAGADWQDTELQRSAAEIPGVSVSSDVAGVEGERFGAKTSGHTFLFAADGRLLFDGGITASRGHAGDNVGHNSIAALLNRDAAERTRTRVFGCSLVSAQAITTAARRAQEVGK